MDKHEALKEIKHLSNKITGNQFAFETRRRLNPHHDRSSVKAEVQLFNTTQKNLFNELKALFADYRDVIYTIEGLDENDKEIMDALEKCIQLDMERAFDL